MENKLKEVIDKIHLLEGRIDKFKSYDIELRQQLMSSNAENARLKTELELIKNDIALYIQELEEIRKNYGSSNLTNK